MTISSTVAAVHADASGTLTTARTRIKGCQLTPGGTAGEIVFTNGGSSGAALLTLHITTNLVPIPVVIPENGILFPNGVYVTLPAGASVTMFYV